MDTNEFIDQRTASRSPAVLEELHAKRTQHEALLQNNTRRLGLIFERYEQAGKAVLLHKGRIKADTVLEATHVTTRNDIDDTGTARKVFIQPHREVITNSDGTYAFTHYELWIVAPKEGLPAADLRKSDEGVLASSQFSFITGEPFSEEALARLQDVEGIIGDLEKYGDMAHEAPKQSLGGSTGFSTHDNIHLAW